MTFAFRPEIFIILGILLSLACSEGLNLSPGGVVVPGYVALCLNRPLELAVTLGAALAAFFTIKIAGRFFFLFGKRRFALCLLSGLAWGLLFRAFAPAPGAILRIGGFLIPGILASEMTRQGALKTFAAMAAVSAAVFLAGTGLTLLLGAQERRAEAAYTEILEGLHGRNRAGIIGEEYTALTTTLGSPEAKLLQLDPAAAGLMARLLKDAGVRRGAKIAVNASGSFPGFVFASLAACRTLGLDAVLVVSLGASSYGANIPGWTVADMLFAASAMPGAPLAGVEFAAITPGGSGDAGKELDRAELERAALLAQSHGVPFVVPASLDEALALREAAFKDCAVLVNVGGNHPSTFASEELSRMGGLIRPTDAYAGQGLVGNFLSQGKPVIQVLNVRQLFRQFGIGKD
ncbi:MAG: poly-gamma-glutamate system protein [Spirochaetaceae bacterium]|jgi:poly-gamma-glutamate biosynthesis protein PgsC/CapC|nr:poly-gamma-glutamate system protein [Spirochaetaceae bacterium]